MGAIDPSPHATMRQFISTTNVVPLRRVAVDKRYKHQAGRGGRRKRRGMDTRLWVPTSQLKCHCPKVLLVQ